MRTIRQSLLVALTVASTMPVAATAQTIDSTQSKFQPPITIQYLRPQDKRGINVFETTKEPGVAYDGFKMAWGAAFTQQFQGLSHENTATPRLVGGVNQNQLKDIGHGFNNAVANLYLHAQLAPGIRVQMTSYLSSRHHNETWVKDGFLQVDASPIDIPILNNIMKYTTLKIGHFQVNYGDFQYRRTDNGQAMYNPFVGNAIMDAFTTEIGTEVIVQRNGIFGVAALTNGEIRGNITGPKQRSPAAMFKAGVDKQVNEDLRVRLSASYRNQGSAISNTLWSGDRAGSRYYFVLENTAATESAQFTSGRYNPGFSDKNRAYMINPFVKFHGLEFFGMYEQAEGRRSTETVNREATQTMAELIYRFLPGEKVYVGGRLNTVEAEVNTAGETKGKITRTNIGGGWFVTPSLMLKAELVTQKYDNFLATDIRRGGKFNGFMVEGTVAF